MRRRTFVPSLEGQEPCRSPPSPSPRAPSSAPLSSRSDGARLTPDTRPGARSPTQRDRAAAAVRSGGGDRLARRTGRSRSDSAAPVRTDRRRGPRRLRAGGRPGARRGTARRPGSADVPPRAWGGAVRAAARAVGAVAASLGTRPRHRPGPRAGRARCREARADPRSRAGRPHAARRGARRPGPPHRPRGRARTARPRRACGPRQAEQRRGGEGPHRTVTARRCPGTGPANVTFPAHGARTASPARAARSTPRCPQGANGPPRERERPDHLAAHRGDPVRRAWRRQERRGARGRRGRAACAKRRRWPAGHGRARAWTRRPTHAVTAAGTHPERGAGCPRLAGQPAPPRGRPGSVPAGRLDRAVQRVRRHAGEIADAAAAGRARAPAPTSRRRASMAGSSSAAAALAPPATTTISPRGSASAYRAASWGPCRARPPRAPSSARAHRDRPLRVDRSERASEAASRLGDSNATTVSGARHTAPRAPPCAAGTRRSARRRRQRARHQRRQRGARPREHLDRHPRRHRARTRMWPGRRPAASPRRDTSATTSPAAIRSTSSAARERSLCS